MPILLQAIEVGNWTKGDVIIGGVAASLLVAILGVQIWATRETRKAAIAAKESSDAAVAANDRAQTEMAIRLAPIVSIRGVMPYVVKDIDGLVMLREDPDTGILDLGKIGPTASSFYVVFQLTIVNSGPVAALGAGYGIGQGFNRDGALQQMRDDTGYVDSLIPPHTTTTHDFDIPLANVRQYRLPDGSPYFVAASVAYKNLDKEGQLVEVEWQFQGSKVQLLRHSAPEPYPSD